MLARGDLNEDEEYFNPVIFDFLLFASEAAREHQPVTHSPSPTTTFQSSHHDKEAQAFSTNI